MHLAGAVGNLQKIKEAVMVARKILEETYHTLLVGTGATAFALQMGFGETSLSTQQSKAEWARWVANGKLPNFWRDPSNVNNSVSLRAFEPFDPNDLINEFVHDTIGTYLFPSPPPAQKYTHTHTHTPHTNNRYRHASHR